MAQVDITVNGRVYKVTCENGQEQRLTELATYLDRHVSELTESLGQIGEGRLLLLAALTVCDELFETRAQLFSREPGADTGSDNAVGEQLQEAANRVVALTERLREAS